MKNTAIILTVFCALTAFRGGNGDYAPAIRQQAENMGKALVKKNYAIYIKYTDPRIIQDMGGEAAFADSLKGYETQWRHYNIK